VIVRLFRDDDSAVVACGSSRDHAEIAGSVCVSPGSPGYRALRLSAETYFYPSNVVIAELGALTPRDCRCTPSLLLDLRDVEKRAYAQRGDQMPYIPAAAAKP
jgi:hypothetical protein